jgi:mRNA-degrading endonuclease toxin of MazEF toxin-antitoxin module
MSHYTPGDVVIVPFPHEGENTKVRPVIVLAVKTNGDLTCCPIRSTPRAGALCIPISIDDFSEGGLDLFLESYVQIDTIQSLKSGVVIGKKGWVTREFFDMLGKRISVNHNIQ